jgi:HEAT repeat protein
MNSLFGADAPRGAVLTALDRLHSSYAILISLVAIAVLALVLHQLGVIGFVVRAVSAAVRGGTAAGFRVWERLFSWAPWPLFLALVLLLLAAGSFSASSAPWFTVAAGLLTVVMGVSACLAYMAIDVERYEVERGYKAIHNPLKGQLLATNLVRHGRRVGVPLLAAAAVAAVGGFALLNLGLYATVGAGWYAVGDDQTLPEFADFLVYALVHLYRLVDMLDLTVTQNMMRFTVVRPTLWPAGLLLGAYKTFFTLVLLQQLFASIRQSRALAESIADFWSPHPPIHERARNALPQYGVGVVGPLLESLREVPALTKELRDQLPAVLAGIGPAGIPALVGHLADPDEGERAASVAALGLLGAVDALPAVAALATDASAGPALLRAARTAEEALREQAVRALILIRPPELEEALTGAMTDPSPAVRKVATAGWMKADAVPDAAVAVLVEALRDPEVQVRANAAHALGRLDALPPAAVPGLTECAAHPNDGLRLNAAVALRNAPNATSTLAGLIGDPNSRVRLIAAGAVLARTPDDAPATQAVVAALSDPSLRLRQVGFEVVAALGERAGGFRAALAERATHETDANLRARVEERLARLAPPAE